MSDNPDQIRADIERTRNELGTDVDALADKVNPSNVAHRQADKVRSKTRNAMTTVKERVMGVAHDAEDKMHSVTDRAQSSGQSATDRLHEGQRRIGQQAEGHPLAVGLMAFGAGLLISTLIPPSRKERELAGSLKENSESMMQTVTDAAKQTAENLKGPAQDAMDSVKQTATDAAEHVKSDATDAAHDVKGSATDSAQRVQGEARS